MLRPGVLLALLTLPALAQETGAPQEAKRDEFRQTAIPPGIPARFLCHQNGAEIVVIDAVASFAPARVQGVMTFSVATRSGQTHLLYLGGETACRLEVTPG